MEPRRSSGSVGGPAETVVPDDAETSVALLRRARAGEDQALDRLIGRYLPRFRRWASRRLPPWARDAFDTDDLVQETLLHAIQHVKHFEPRHDGAFQAYLRQAMSNRICDAVRKAGRTRKPITLDSGEPDHGPSPLEMTIGHETFERYEAALARLPAVYREAIVARIELGQNWVEVAQVLGKPTPDAARMIVTRAVRRLAQEMAAAQQAPENGPRPASEPEGDPHP